MLYCVTSLLCVCTLAVVCGAHCMSVTILNADPSHVILGSSLVLRARIEHGPLETVTTVTWQREPETGDARGRKVLASCSPGGPAGCPAGHMTLDAQATSLRVDAFSADDGGIYSLAVTDQSGARTTVYCVVREYGRTNSHTGYHKVGLTLILVTIQ